MATTKAAQGVTTWVNELLLVTLICIGALIVSVNLTETSTIDYGGSVVITKVNAVILILCTGLAYSFVHATKTNPSNLTRCWQTGNFLDCDHQSMLYVMTRAIRSFGAFVSVSALTFFAVGHVIGHYIGCLLLMATFGVYLYKSGIRCGELDCYDDPSALHWRTVPIFVIWVLSLVIIGILTIAMLCVPFGN